VVTERPPRKAVVRQDHNRNVIDSNPIAPDFPRLIQGAAFHLEAAANLLELLERFFSRFSKLALEIVE
jgi:hypothetical protein